MRKLIIGIFILTAAIGAASVWYQKGYSKYDSVFLPNTYINNLDVSGMSIDQVDSKLQTPLQDVTISYLDDTETISAAQLNASESYESDIRKAFDSQDHFWWFKSLWHASYFHASPNVNYDLSGLIEIVQEMSFAQNYEEPVNASIVYENGMFQIQKEADGSKPDIDKIIEKITTAVQNEMYKIDVSDCQVQPSVTVDDLSLSEQMDTLNSRDAIEINIGGEQTYSLKKDEFQEIISWDGSNISIDSNLLSDCVQALSDKFSTFGKSRQFITHGGEEVSVGGSVKDDFGYEMNQEETKENLSEAILTGQTSCEISWKQKGKTRSDLNDFGTTYAEVSIKDQHVWYYKDGECVFESDTVTGLPALGGTTPGVFHILYKQSPSVLKGEDYETPVSYWMPFTYTGTGFHDASWRSKFGGSLYLTTGSHGCVNLPAAKAAELYSLIQTGDPVIVY